MDHTILVVDDEPACLRALKRALSPLYRVLAAERGDAGLALLTANEVSLIVTDHRMPGMTGVEMLARCRATHPDVIRLILTGYADVDALIEAINDGAVFYYLTKPWEPQELLLAVRRGIERLEAERQRHALTRNLHQACELARREAEQKTRLLATAAHELGTPLNLVGNAVDLLGAVPAVRENPALPIAERGLAWLRRALAQMHTGFRLRAGQVRLVREPFDAAESLRAILLLASRASADRRLDFRTAFDAGLAVHGDRRWLEQVWINLVSNAIRFTPDGGSIDVSGTREGDGIVVRIADDGTGMRPEQVACAFDAFSTAAGDLLLHGSGRFEFGARGLGLGLSIAKAIVELHEGTIRLESDTARGTVAEVRLPGAGPQKKEKRR